MEAMSMRWVHGISMLAAATALALAGPASADVKAGVDAWSAGDYAAAVKEWQGDAAKGDADAQFNLAQAYRLGRGIPQDNAKAMELYAKSAASGHIQAADHYGLMLFQAGRRDEALPYVEAAAGRGDPRAEYLLGIAHFNGDQVEKDWPRAYALMTMANASGLPQAAPAMVQMDEFIPLKQRQQGVGLAIKLQKQADAARTSQLAAADLGGGVGKASAIVQEESPKAPQTLASATPPPSVAAEPSEVEKARLAVADAANVTGAESPAEAGADYARPATKPAPKQIAAAAVPAPSPPEPPVSKKAPAAPSPKTASAAATTSGPWQVQLGTFSVGGNADKMWQQLSGRSELSGKSKIVKPSGKFTVLSAGGFASKADAVSACATLKRTGQGCLVTH